MEFKNDVIKGKIINLVFIIATSIMFIYRVYIEHFFVRYYFDIADSAREAMYAVNKILDMSFLIISCGCLALAVMLLIKYGKRLIEMRNTVIATLIGIFAIKSNKLLYIISLVLLIAALRDMMEYTEKSTEDEFGVNNMENKVKKDNENLY